MKKLENLNLHFSNYREQRLIILAPSMATVHNPNNWHWVDKNCLPWAKEYLSANIPAVSHDSISVKEIRTVSGDCDVTQRKGKVRCIFELKVEFVVNVKKGEEEEAEEVVIILPEFEHDYDSDDFNFEIKTNKFDNKTLIRKEFIPLVVEKVFLRFQPDLLIAHEPNMKHNTD